MCRGGHSGGGREPATLSECRRGRAESGGEKTVEKEANLARGSGRRRLMRSAGLLDGLLEGSSMEAERRIRVERRGNREGQGNRADGKMTPAQFSRFGISLQNFKIFLLP